MSFLDDLNPLDFCCPQCRNALRWDDGIGVQFKCGHVNCCTSGEAIKQHCLRPECKNKRQPVFLDYHAKHTKIAKGEMDLIRKLAYIPCWQCQNIDLEQSINLGSVSDFPQKVFCGECARKQSELLWGMIHYSFDFMWSSLADFPQNYTDFSRQLALRGMDLSFRNELDHLIARFLNESRHKSLLEVFRYGRRCNLEVRFVNPLSLVVLDRRLDKLGRIFRRLSYSMDSHSKANLLTELSRAAFGDSRDHRLATLVPKPKQSPTAMALEDLMAMDWPTGAHLLRSQRKIWNELRELALPSHLFPKKKIRKSSRNVLSLVFRKEINPQRRLFRRSSVLRPGDIWFVSECLPGIIETNCLVQISDETNSGYKFHEAVKDKPNTLLLIHSEGRRFGYFLSQAWSGPGHEADLSVLFLDLDLRTCEPLSYDLPSIVKSISLHMGPHISCDFTSNFRKRVPKTQIQFCKKLKFSCRFSNPRVA